MVGRLRGYLDALVSGRLIVLSNTRKVSVMRETDNGVQWAHVSHASLEEWGAQATALQIKRMFG
jgi:hypothetical protein